LAQKKAAVFQTLVSPDMDSDCMMPGTNPIRPIHPTEPSENKAIDTQAYAPITGTENISHTQNVPVPILGDISYLMPFLDAQLKRVKELGYHVPTPSQSVGNIDSRFRGPNRHPNNIPAPQRTQIYQDNSNIDYVDQLAPYDRAMALWKERRIIANQFKNK
jgi:hypothetical protein